MTSTMRRTSNGSMANGPNGGGRTTSQISIYDYPEHLNPFHEDDQHKRLRFWKMSTTNKGSGRDRSNSFSLNGLKEMWAFKSFRLKKRSSVLGINKTSESPPQMRRQQDAAAEATAQLFDSRMRHTITNGGGGAAGASNFDRGAGYRSSSTATLDARGSSIGFNRNDRYRSTIQNGFQTTPHPRSAYVHNGGSVTPTPARSSLLHGLSQSSLNSTNPFDEDDDDADGYTASAASTTADNDDNVSRVTVNVLSDGAGGVRKVYRKKRRAPPPPPPRTSSVAASADIPQSENSSSTITTVKEASRENSTEDDNENDTAAEHSDISQLAAQIASFVLTADTDGERLRNSLPDDDDANAPNRSAASTTINTSNGHVISTTPTVVHVVDVHQQQHHYDPPHSPPASALRRQLPASARDSPESNGAYPDSRTPTPTRDTSRDRSSAADSEKQLNTVERVAPLIIVRSATTDDEDDDEDVNVSGSLERKPLPAVPEAATAITTTTTTSIVRIVEQPRRQTAVVHSLLIAESNDDLSSSTESPASDISLKIIESAEDVREPPPTPPAADPERYKIRFVALRPTSMDCATNKPQPSPNKPKWTAPWSSSSKNKTASSPTSTNAPVVAKVKTNGNDGVELRSGRMATTDDDEAGSPVAVAPPPRRRRSVKDIIESINASQSLLRINQSDAAESLTVDKRVTSLETINYRNNGDTTTNNNGPIAPSSPSSESIVRNLSELQASEQQIRQTIAEMEQHQNSGSGSDRNNNHNGNNGHSNGNGNDAEHDDVLHQLPIMVERYAEFSSEFKKCTANPAATAATSSPVLVRRRDKSAGDSSEAEQRRTDWNPLPKPRRSRHLTHEQQATSATTK